MNKTFAGIILLVMFAVQVVKATVITPSYTTFGALPVATFGGTGIPNDAVAISEFTEGNFSVVLGLTAHQRFDNPPLGNDGAGRFSAVTGGDAAHGQPGYARWNFGYYHNFSPELLDVDAAAAGYALRLYYDLDPSVGNDVSTFVVVDPIGINGATMDFENSLNLGMNSIFGLGFDPDLPGEYGLALGLYKDGIAVGTPSAILTTANDPSSVPDSGSTIALLSFCAIGIGSIRQRLKDA